MTNPPALDIHDYDQLLALLAGYLDGLRSGEIVVTPSLVDELNDIQALGTKLYAAREALVRAL